MYNNTTEYLNSFNAASCTKTMTNPWGMSGKGDTNIASVDGAVRRLLLTLRSDMTKEEYMEWVKEWKATIKNVETTIRNLKKFRKPAYILEKASPLAKLTPEDATSIASKRRHEALWLRISASELIKLRSISKVLANASYLKNVRRVNQ